MAWIFTDAREKVDCPKCRAKSGSDCTFPSGRKKWPPHGERITNLHQRPDFKVEDYQ